MGIVGHRIRTLAERGNMMGQPPPFRIRDDLSLRDRLYHSYQRIMFANKLEEAYMAVQARSFSGPAWIFRLVL